MRQSCVNTLLYVSTHNLCKHPSAERNRPCTSLEGNAKDSEELACNDGSAVGRVFIGDATPR